MDNINTQEQEQTLTLINKSNLTITSTEKIISLKPELIQLSTKCGGVVIIGQKLELNKLDDKTNTTNITGEVSEIKFVNTTAPKSLNRKIFK